MSNASLLLEKFGEYQLSINHPEHHINHHDYAVLVTKFKNY